MADRYVRVAMASTFFITTAIVSWSCALGVNSIVSVPGSAEGVWPGAAAELVAEDSFHTATMDDLAKVQLSFGEARCVPLAQRTHHVVTVVAGPGSWLEPAPLHLGREDRPQRVEVAAAPGIESLLRNGQARAVAHHASSAGVTLGRSRFRRTRAVRRLDPSGC